MSILFVYEGPRNRSLEDSVCRDLTEAVGAVRQTGSHSGEDGMTTVTLEIADDRKLPDAVERLRGRADVMDAVIDSFGEHV